MPKFTTLERFIWRDPDTGCWWWTGALSGDGYARVAAGRTSCGAHRVVYNEVRGEIPLGHELDHTCRNRACVNPFHSEPVTHKINSQRRDMTNVSAANRSRKGETRRKTPA